MRAPPGRASCRSALRAEVLGLRGDPSGRLPYVKLGRNYRYAEESIDAFVAGLKPGQSHTVDTPQGYHPLDMKVPRPCGNTPGLTPESEFRCNRR